MKAYTEKLHEELLNKLEDLDNQYDTRVLTDMRLALIVHAIEEIKQKLKTYQFLSEEEEIHYFKSVLPRTLAIYIYYSDRIEWDRIRVHGTPECKYKFTDWIYSQSEKFRNMNKDFYEYCRDGKIHLDRFYFLRDSAVNQDGPYALRPIVERSSPGVYCERVARLLAYTRLEHELHHQVVEHGEIAGIGRPGKSKLKWTDKTISLVEIGYALHAQGSFNHGNASLKDIFKFFDEVFDVELRNTARQFQDILARKTGNSIFLNLLIEKLEKRIEDIENEHLN